ncbi:MAG: polyphosphate kinase 1 [Pseudomonadales bacterium]
MAVLDLTNASLYINRELSQLEFCHRVLAMARDPNLPLLERVRYLSITSGILDEFFEIRVAGVKQQESYGTLQRDADELSAHELLQNIFARTEILVAGLYATLNEDLIPALSKEKIRLLRSSDWKDEQRDWLKRYFSRQVAPIITPVGLDPAHPFPEPANKNLAFMVTLEGRDAFGRDSRRAVVQAPRSLPRIVELPPNLSGGERCFVLLTSIVNYFVSDLFLGMKATGCHQFRVTRNSDLFVDEEAVDDLLLALEGELSSRRFGDAVRLEVAIDCPAEVSEFLLDQFELSEQDLYYCNGPVNLGRLEAIPELVERADLKFSGFRPSVPEQLRHSENIFETISQGDILIHHPFESFAPFVEMLNQAARDPQVVSIRQTLYRTGTVSAVAEALLKAARAGKDVTVVIELRARFDEAANIELANALQAAGAQVVYGVVGHKTHAKMCMIIRREGRRLVRYVHLGTGNYHPGTSRVYTDYGLLSCNQDLGQDVQKIFQQVAALGKPGKLKALLQSPFTLHSGILELIEAQRQKALQGQPALIQAKMNGLTEQKVIDALYKASQAGVQIDLIVRGMCCLRPGVKGVSENIHVRSVVGRFLEHMRVFCFGIAEEREVFLSSADWMERNFFLRIETCFPLRDPDLAKRVYQEAISNYLDDNLSSWELSSDGRYREAKKRGKPHSAQERLLVELSEHP